MAKRVITKDHIQSTKRTINHEITITPEGGNAETATLLQATFPFAGIPSFTRQALVEKIGTTSDALFKEMRRTSHYKREWEFLKLVPDKGTREWTMIALSLCAQLAAETSVFHPYLEEDTRKWLKAKFCQQGVSEDFDSRWHVYRNTPVRDLAVPGHYYLRVPTKPILINWVGSIPVKPSSPQLRLSLRETHSG